MSTVRYAVLAVRDRELRALLSDLISTVTVRPGSGSGSSSGEGEVERVMVSRESEDSSKQSPVDTLEHGTSTGVGYSDSDSEGATPLTAAAIKLVRLRIMVRVSGHFQSILMMISILCVLKNDCSDTTFFGTLISYHLFE